MKFAIALIFNISPNYLSPFTDVFMEEQGSLRIVLPQCCSYSAIYPVKAIFAKRFNLNRLIHFIRAVVNIRSDRMQHRLRSGIRVVRLYDRQKMALNQ